MSATITLHHLDMEKGLRFKRRCLKNVKNKLCHISPFGLLSGFQNFPSGGENDDSFYFLFPRNREKTFLVPLKIERPKRT